VVESGHAISAHEILPCEPLPGRTADKISKEIAMKRNQAVAFASLTVAMVAWRALDVAS